MVTHNFKLKRHSLMMEKSQEDKQTCFPCSSLRPGSPRPGPVTPCLLYGQIQFTEPTSSIQCCEGEKEKKKKNSHLWKLCCPGKGSVKYDSQHKEGGWAAGEPCGSAVRMRSRCCIAEPLPRSGPWAAEASLPPVSTGKTQICRVLTCRAVRPSSQSAL